LREEALKLFSLISRTHSYWGRKPLLSILEILQELDIKKGDILLDPFCGGGTAVLAALIKGARVIAGDLNPTAVFLTEVLIRPLNMATLKYFYQNIEQNVKDEILNLYKIKCPACGNDAIIDYLVWKGKKEEAKPVQLRINCHACNKKMIDPLKEPVKLKNKSYKIAGWYPKSRIKSKRKTEVKFHYQLFTRRNLKALSLLLAAISKIKVENYRNALQYVFTSILYNCSEMQMYSEKYPNSSRGWTVIRYYTQNRRKEKNVWYAFSSRFGKFVDCKNYMYDILPELTEISITDTETKFYQEDYHLLIKQSDIFNPSSRFTNDIKYCFLDPPCYMDVDYLNFSQFWGSWLKMKFPAKNDFCPDVKKLTGYFQIISTILQSVVKNSHRDIIIILAFGLKLKNIEDQFKEMIERSGLFIHKKLSVVYRNKQIRSDRKDNFYILGKQRPEQSQSKKMDEDETKDKYLNYYRATAFLHYGKERIIHRNIETLISGIIPAEWYEELPPVTGAEMKASINNISLNQKCYNSLCLALLDIILKSDHLIYSHINESLFNRSFINLPHVDAANIIDEFTDAALVVTDYHTDYVFCFSDQDKNTLEKIIKKVNYLDKNEFKKICILIERDDHIMRKNRKIEYADQWERVFFISFGEIRDRAEKIDSESCRRLLERRIKEQDIVKQTVKGVDTYYAEVLENIPIGRSNDPNEPKHYKLRFRVKGPFKNILPGQFIMIDTIPLRQKMSSCKNNKSIRLKGYDTISDTYAITAAPYLLRPFGIHRAYYEHFAKDYLKKIKLPQNLSLILNTVYPYEFDIFYKVLEKGVGTKNLTRLKPSFKGKAGSGDMIRIIAPLGTRYDLRKIREEGIENIHVIGGGVGMAPLVFLIQSLKFYSFKIKAFVGISSIEFLKYPDDYYKNSFIEQTKDVKIYYDDLMDTGLSEDDTYVSCEKEIEAAQGIKNLYSGNISDYYKQFLAKNRNHNKTVAFSCGPTLMMKEINKICQEYKIPLKVLLEKRMACGIGVCFSCVCRVKDKTGDYHNSKVCVDGPIYNAEDVKELNDE
jgi:NAD(P)H-flavin reductase